MNVETTPTHRNPFLTRISTLKTKTHSRLTKWHSHVPYFHFLPLPAILIILLLILLNLLAWTISALILSSHSHTHLLGTAALAFSLGLRHALDADHISAIDLMTRRLIATGQRPVTVGTFFSLGHSTIVIVTSIVVAATAAGVSERFEGFSNVGGIIGTSVSAAFLILLGVMNAYILFRLVIQIQKVIKLQPEVAAEEAWKIQGGGCLFRVLKKMFKLIDRPWKMYPLGVLFGLGFDTSSEVALLGISSIQGAQGTSIWLILLFPVLFTAGMCLIDTIDGALMMSLYIAPMGMSSSSDDKPLPQPPNRGPDTANTMSSPQLRPKVKDPLTFLYYSIVLTTLTVLCAIIIGLIQLLSLILNTAHPTGRFWNGVARASDHYEIIGGAICASFVVFGGLSVVCYGPWKRRVDRGRQQRRELGGEGADGEVGEENGGRDGEIVDELVEVDGKGVMRSTRRDLIREGEGSGGR